MSSRLGLISQIWKGIRQGYNVARTSERFIGEDHLGNRYYEIKEDSSKGVRGSRTVKGPTDDQFEVPKIPTEWNAWLRKNRDDPPSQEELDRNRAMALHKQIKGRELQMKHEQEAQDGAAEGLIHRMKNSKAEESDFPAYDEYEEFPGDERPTKSRDRDVR